MPGEEVIGSGVGCAVGGAVDAQNGGPVISEEEASERAWSEAGKFEDPNAFEWGCAGGGHS